MRSSTLVECVLDEADLQSAILINANGARASLWSANLAHACLSCSNFEGANFQRVKLNNADTFQAVFKGADLRNIKAKDAYFGYSILEDCKLDDATISRTRFDLASLKGASLKNARFTHCSFVNCSCNRVQAQGASFTGSDLQFSQFSDAHLAAARVFDCKLYGSSFWNITGDGIQASGLDISVEGDGSLLTDEVVFAPLSFLLEQGHHFVELIHSIRLKSVLVLGQDTGAGWDLLKEIQKTLRDHGLIGIIAKEQANIVSDTTIRKINTLAALSQFVILENTRPSGHLYEFCSVKNLDCPIAVLQEEGKGATRMFDDIYGKTQFIKRFDYKAGQAEYSVDEAISWAQALKRRFVRENSQVNRWLTDPGTRNLL